MTELSAKAAFLSAALTLGACAAAHKAAPAQPLNQTVSKKVYVGRDLMQLIEKSPVTYSIGAIERGEVDPEAELARDYPPVRPPLTKPRVVDQEGHRAVLPGMILPAVQEVLARAEVPYGQKDFAKAAEIAAEAAKIDPNESEVWLYLGDCVLFGGDPQKALEDYDRAAKLNPYDYRAFFFRSTALLRMGKVEEAKKSYAHALALRPRYPTLIEAINKAEGLPFRVAEPFFYPRVRVEKVDEKHVKVQVEQGGDHWLAWGLCKAVWEMEPGRRVEASGSQAHLFSSFEEVECLVNLVTVYVNARAEKRVSVDDGMELLRRLMEEDRLSMWVLYELASRLDPQIVIAQGDAVIARVAEMIEQDLFVPRHAERADAAPVR